MPNQYEKANRNFAIYASLGISLLFLFLAVVLPEYETVKENIILYVGISAALALAVFILLNLPNRKRKHIIKTDFPEQWKKILQDKVDFYRQLNPKEKEKFENQVAFFLSEKKITGVDTEVDDTDRLLVASSAVIPVFGFDEWEYYTLDEVLLYPDSFNDKYESGGDDKGILGMVGTGNMSRVMILSKPALHHGFANSRDKKNVGIHEFVHLIDRASGAFDGIPPSIIQNQFTIPWIELVRKKIDEIMENESDINPYGASNSVEFFAVAGEYFFERPKLLAEKHPQLYELLNKAFKIDMKSMLRNKMRPVKKIGRNAPCPCGSGKKYKHCCLKKKKQAKLRA